MRIGISLLDFQPGKSGGIETYCRDLIAGLEQTDHRNSYVVLLNLFNKGTLSVKSSNFQIVYVDEKSIKQKILGKLGNRVSNEQLMQQCIQALGLDILHFPLQTIQPYLITLDVKKIISIMDIQQEYYPEFFDKTDLDNRREAYRKSCDAATLIISISDFTKNSLVEKFDINPSKIKTVHLNFDESLLSGGKSHQPVSGKYFYYPAASWPHKNHLKLLRAFKTVQKEYPDYKLVLTGISKQKANEVQDYIQNNFKSGSVEQLGYVDRSVLAGLYKHAFALVFPSLFEGFGIPVVDAMVCKCPVICADTTSLPEIAGKAALYCDPKSPTDIASKMTKLIEDESLRNKLVRFGEKQAQKFTRYKMVANTLRVYDKVARMK